MHFAKKCSGKDRSRQVQGTAAKLWALGTHPALPTPGWSQGRGQGPSEDAYKTAQRPGMKQETALREGCPDTSQN